MNFDLYYFIPAVVSGVLIAYFALLGIAGFEEDVELNQIPRWGFGLSLVIFPTSIVGLLIESDTGSRLSAFAVGLIMTFVVGALYQNNKGNKISLVNDFLFGSNNERGLRSLAKLSSGPKMRFPWERIETDVLIKRTKVPFSLKMRSMDSLLNVKGGFVWTPDSNNLQRFAENNMNKPMDIEDYIKNIFIGIVSGVVSDKIGKETDNMIIIDKSRINRELSEVFVSEAERYGIRILQIFIEDTDFASEQMQKAYESKAITKAQMDAAKVVLVDMGYNPEEKDPNQPTFVTNILWNEVLDNIKENTGKITREVYELRGLSDINPEVLKELTRLIPSLKGVKK